MKYVNKRSICGVMFIISSISALILLGLKEYGVFLVAIGSAALWYINLKKEFDVYLTKQQENL